MNLDTGKSCLAAQKGTPERIYGSASDPDWIILADDDNLVAEVTRRCVTKGADIVLRFNRAGWTVVIEPHLTVCRARIAPLQPGSFKIYSGQTVRGRRN